MKNIALKMSALLVTAAMVSGCVALGLGAAAGAGTAVYVKGQHKETVDAAVPQVHQATIAALQDSGITIQEESVDDFSADIKGKMSDGTNVWIDLKRQTASTTQIGVRVGATGDQEESAAIVDRIKNRLPAA